jgi:hypothetical protein
MQSVAALPWLSSDTANGSQQRWPVTDALAPLAKMAYKINRLTNSCWRAAGLARRLL